jgi:hypothetical protein
VFPAAAAAAGVDFCVKRMEVHDLQVRCWLALHSCSPGRSSSSTHSLMFDGARMIEHYHSRRKQSNSSLCCPATSCWCFSILPRQQRQQQQQ